jgi:hypothetical protein
VTEQIPPATGHVVEEKPAWLLAPRPVPQTTFPVGDCPVTVAVHLVCEPAFKGLVCEPAGEQTTVMLVDWAVASCAGSRTKEVRTKGTARRTGITDRRRPTRLPTKSEPKLRDYLITIDYRHSVTRPFYTIRMSSNELMEKRIRLIF